MGVPALVLGIVLVVGAVAAKVLYEQAMTVRSHLVAAVPHAQDAQDAILAGDLDAASLEIDRFANEAKLASAAAQGRLWSVAEHVPFGAGANFSAVRSIAEISDDLADSVLQPAARIDLAALTPSHGGMDLARVQDLGKVVNEMKSALVAASERLHAIETGQLIPQVAEAVADVGGVLDEATPVLTTASQVADLLPGALGADGPRNYLVMMQGISEIRAGGGNPAAMLLLQVSAGDIRIVRQASSADFQNARPTSVMPLDAETEAIYSDILGRWIPNMTGTPDFPTTVALMKAWWAEEYDDDFDAVISVDPVALGYMLRATGPLTLSTGDKLDSKNAASLLLKDAYFMYPKGADSTKFFASVALTVFDSIMDGKASPIPFAQALAKAADEGRLKYWSMHPTETAALGDSVISGVLPSTNRGETAVGVYFNDTTGSKMDYFVDAEISLTTNQCEVEVNPEWTTRVTLSNKISRDEARDLPEYITGPYYTPGDIATDFIVYSPVGATIESWTLNGEEYPAVSHGSHLGRDVLRVSVLTPPLLSSTLEVKIKGDEDASSYGAPDVRHTPMVRTTPLTIDASGCASD